jgi:hypothetical protein
MPEIPATQEVEIRRMWLQAILGKKLVRSISTTKAGH